MFDHWVTSRKPVPLLPGRMSTALLFIGDNCRHSTALSRPNITDCKPNFVKMLYRYGYVEGYGDGLPMVRALFEEHSLR